MDNDTLGEPPRSPLRTAGVYEARPLEGVVSALAGSEATISVDLRSGPTISGVVESVAEGVAVLVDSRGSLIYVRVAAIDAITVIDTHTALNALATR